MASEDLLRQLGIPAHLHDLKEAGLFRERLLLGSPQGAEVVVDGRRLINFSSNDYLGLASDPRLADAVAEGARQYGSGSGASPLVCGRLAVHEELETALAAFLRRDRVLLFSSGYLANLAGIQGLVGRGDLVFQDRLNHASLLDGVTLSRARLKRYPHRDAKSLEPLLSRAEPRKLVVTDSIFSVDGDVAPLRALAEVCRRRGALLMVDEAHAFGVLGGGGRGALEEAGLGQADAPLMMATFGKALGGSGAFLAGTDMLVEFLVQSARTYIYSTAPSPAIAAAGLAALRLVQEEPWRRAQLSRRIAYFRDRATARGILLQDSATAIQPLLIGDAGDAARCSEQLAQHGMLVRAMRPPTVPRGTARLRITLSAVHREDHLDALVDALATCLPRPARAQ